MLFADDRTGQPDADEGSKLILMAAEAHLAMAVPGKGNAAPWIAKLAADWLESLGSHTGALKCGNEPAILALAQETRRLRREDSITILEHPEEDEKQSNHLADNSVNIVKSLIRTLQSSTESKFRTEIGPSQALIPWIIVHAAEFKNRNMVGADGSTLSAWCSARKFCSNPLAPARRGDFGASTGSTWCADHSTARRTLEHSQE